MRRFLAPIAARYGAVVLQFIVVAVITRVLGQADAGQYFVIMGMVWATYFIAGFGLPDGVVRFAPTFAATNRERESASLLSRGLRYSLATVPIGAGICCCVVAIYSGSIVPAILSAVWWASYGVVFISAQMLVATGRSELGTAMFYSAANSGQIIITVPLILLVGFDNLNEVLLATVAGTAIASAACLIVAWRKCGQPIRTEGALREVWQQGAVIASGRVVQACLIWSPVWVASIVLGPSDAALVGLASRLVSAVAAVIAAIRFSIRPSLARDAAEGNWRSIEKQSSRIALVATGLAAIAIVAMVSVGDPIISLMFGAEYRGAGLVTALMLIGTVGESFGGPVDEVLRMSGYATEVIIAQIAILMLSIGAQLVAGSLLGLTALVVTYGLMVQVLYLGFIGRLRHLHGIWIFPRLRRDNH